MIKSQLDLAGIVNLIVFHHGNESFSVLLLSHVVETVREKNHSVTPRQIISCDGW